MNLFQQIEGLQGEKLASKVLSLLLLRSQELRKIFIDMISNESTKGPLSTSSRFACVCEHRTENELFGSGYVDILIETDDAIVGIENKFHAPLGMNQLEKYLSTLQKKASHLDALVGKQKSVNHLLVVLLPKDRKEKEKRSLQDKDCVVLAWQEVLTAFNMVASGNLDSMTDVILRILNEFVQEKIGFMPNFTRWVSHFRRSWTPYGNQFHSALLAALRDVFPNPNNKLGSGKTWIGYYFATILEKGQRGWFGFVPSGSIIDGPNRANVAEMIVATTFDVEGISDHAFIKAHVPGILGPKAACYTWIINFDKEWSTPEVWREKLNPFWNRVESIALQQKNRNVSEMPGEAE